MRGASVFTRSFFKHRRSWCHGDEAKHPQEQLDLDDLHKLSHPCYIFGENKVLHGYQRFIGIWMEHIFINFED